MCLLYADDTILFLRPDRTKIIRIKLLLDLFSKIFGLTVNLHKSELLTTSSPFSLTQNLASIIQCKPAPFPIKYLGLPLSDKGLKRADYHNLIEKVQAALTGWKASLLSIGGCITLVNAVLSAIPQYFMSIFMLPKWVIKRIDRIRRLFLWHGHKNLQNQQRGLYMVNWRLTTKPRSLGGLGFRDIQIANQALMMKWMWLWIDWQQAWWKQATIVMDESDRPWHDSRGSQFWISMKHIIPAFDCSVTYQIARGNSCKFWHDNWMGTPLKFVFPDLYRASQQKFSSVEQTRNHEGWNLLFTPLTLLMLRIYIGI